MAGFCLKPELRQELKLTPQLLQSMEILQMGSQELLDYINRTAEENPVLDCEETSSLRTDYEALCQKISWLDSRSSTSLYSADTGMHIAASQDPDDLAAFVRDQPPDIRTVVCACNAGESRSAALCAALCEYFRMDSDWIWSSARYHPNMLVFDLMTKALGVPVSDDRMDALFFTNRNAFAEAIRRARQ